MEKKLLEVSLIIFLFRFVRNAFDIILLENTN